MASYGKRAIAGVVSMFTGSLGRQVVSFLPAILIARILGPDSYGVVALTLSLLAIVRVIADMGFSVALVQRKTVTNELTTSAFVGTVALTALICSLVWILAPLIATFFAIPDLTVMFRFAALVCAVQGVSSLYRSLLLRELRYHEIAKLEVIDASLYSALAVGLVYLGFGPLSVVCSQLFASLVVLMIGYRKTGFVPGTRWSFTDMWELLKYGSWVVFGRLVGNAAGKVDTFTIGRVLNAHAVGEYSMAQRLVLMIPTTFTSVVDQVLFPIYSKWQQEPERIEAGYWRALHYSLLIQLPPVCLLALLAETTVYWALGEPWLPTVRLMHILSIFALFQAMGGGIFSSVIYACGRPQIMTLVNTARLIMLPTCVVIGGFWGVEGVAWGFATWGVVGRLFNQYLLNRLLGLRYKKFAITVVGPLAIALLASTLAYPVLRSFSPNTVLMAAIQSVSVILAWMLVYGGLTSLVYGADMRRLVDVMKQLLFRSLRRTEKAPELS